MTILRTLSFSIFALLLAGCSTTIDRNKIPMIQGKVVELHLRNSMDYHQTEVQASKQFAEQKPEALDSPLRIERITSFLSLNEMFEVSFKFAIAPQGNVINVELISTTSETGRDFLGVPQRVSDWRFFPPKHAGRPTGYCCVLVTIER